MTNSPAGSILRTGQTCWRIERASRVAVIIDAADYFTTVREAVMKARHSVMLIGWDFDARISMRHDGKDDDAPNQLGRFLSWAAKHQPGVQIYVLRWNLAAIYAFGRGHMPLVILDWMTDKRIHFRLDAAHPAGAAHHQKIVVIDDALAFCGGIDMTAGRWDTQDHQDEHPGRVMPTTKRPYGPWHDVSLAVEGDVACALGELARDRWKTATGEELEPPPPMQDVWPEGLSASFRDVDVAVSRTAPEYGDQESVHEIEALYLSAVASAEHTIYIESQYFASRRIADAMAERLRQPEGPEIVVINPEAAQGWLAEEVMGSSRAQLLRLIRKADSYDRFRIYTPVTAGRQPIYVHAKVMVVDDRLLKVGSSNLNNRSLGFDTECDLSIEADGSDEATRASILGLRNDLIAEHLGVVSDVLERTIGHKGGSLIDAIETLRSEGRSLVPFVAPELNTLEDALLGENQLLDPERPSRLRDRLRRVMTLLKPGR